MSKSHYLGDGRIGEGVHIARGGVFRTSHIHKFGYNTAVGNSYEDIWSQGGTITYPTSAATFTINSASGNSGSDIFVSGLDANYNQISETVTLDGSGDATSTKSFIRINRAFVSNDDTISGDVEIQIGGNTQAKIETTHQQTMQAIYCVPAGHTAFLNQLSSGVKEKEKDVELRLFCKENGNGGVFRTRDYLTFQTSFTEKNYPVPLKFPEKTDIRLQALCSGATTTISGNFDLVLVED